MKKTRPAHKLTHFHQQWRAEASSTAAHSSKDFLFCERQGRVDGPSFSDCCVPDVCCWEGEGPVIHIILGECACAC